MSVNVTWQEDGQPAFVFVIDDALLATLEKYRMTQTAPVETANGQYATLPKYNSVRDMAVGVYVACLALPAMEMFPPAPLATAEQEAKAARERVEAARKAAIEAIAAPPSPEL